MNDAPGPLSTNGCQFDASYPIHSYECGLLLRRYYSVKLTGANAKRALASHPRAAAVAYRASRATDSPNLSYGCLF
jgi:hypothetical protein